MTSLRPLFYFEVILNVVSIILCWFMPSYFVEQLLPVEVSPMTLELVRWYGLLLAVLTGILALALFAKHFEVLRIVFIVYAIGDIIQVLLTLKMAMTLNIGWTFGLLFTIGISLVLCLGRVLALRKPFLVGY